MSSIFDGFYSQSKKMRARDIIGLYKRKNICSLGAISVLLRRKTEKTPKKPYNPQIFMQTIQKYLFGFDTSIVFFKTMDVFCEKALAI